MLRDWEQEMVDLVTAYCKELDPVVRKDLINQYNYLFTMHNYSLGTIIGRKGLALAKRFENVPGGTPPRMYQWVEDVLMSEVIWTPEDRAEGAGAPQHCSGLLRLSRHVLTATGWKLSASSRLHK